MSKTKRPRSPLRVSPQPTPKIGKAERTRAAIMNAALDFIWKRPFRDLTVSSLTASVGVSRTAFYRYFRDLPEVMETLLDMLQDEIFDACEPWFKGVGDPVALLQEALAGLVSVCHDRGPILRAVTDAAASDKRFERAWNQFMVGFDDATTERIEADQEQDLIPDFDARPVAIALNRLDAHSLIQAFGRHPRNQPEPIQNALTRIWVSTLYGDGRIGEGFSKLVRT